MTTAALEKASLTTAQIVQRLRDRFSAPAYGFLTEVADGTGYGRSRWCDVLAMSLWPSRGLEIIGIEVKASRTDWLKELKNPAKAEAICRYCHRWYVAVGNPSIVKPGELPKTWGLIEPYQSGLAITEGPLLKPVAPDLTFIAAIMRRAAEESTDQDALDAANHTGYLRGRKDGGRTAGLDVDLLERLREKVHAFDKASGLRIESGWEGGEKIGAAVKAVLAREHLRPVTYLERLRKTAQQVVEQLDKDIAEQREAAP